MIAFDGRFSIRKIAAVTGDCNCGKGSVRNEYEVLSIVQYYRNKKIDDRCDDYNRMQALCRNLVPMKPYKIRREKLYRVSSVPGFYRRIFYEIIGTRFYEWKTACARAKNKIVSKVEMFGTKL